MTNDTTTDPEAPTPERSRKGHPTCAPITLATLRRWPGIRTQRIYTTGEIERFLAKVDVRGPDECWPWTAGVVATRPRSPDGYGTLIREGNGPKVYAHRMSLELFTGDGIPDGRFACHHCDYSICCNPAHLYAGTAADNTRDMVERGRSNLGKRWGVIRPAKRAAMLDRLRLRADRNAVICARYAAGGITLRALGAEYGLSESAVCRIVKGSRGAMAERAA